MLLDFQVYFSINQFVQTIPCYLNRSMNNLRSVEENIFGYLDDKTEIKLFKITNENGMVVEVMLDSSCFVIL